MGRPRNRYNMPLIVLLLPFKHRIDFRDGKVFLDGKPLEARIKSRDLYKYLMKKLGVKRYGISRTVIYRKARRLGVSVLSLRLAALRLVRYNKKILMILLEIRIRGRFRSYIKIFLRLLEEERSSRIKSKLLGRRMPKEIDLRKLIDYIPISNGRM